MNIRGPCSDCGAHLATDQRYCIECGARVAAPPALPYMPPATPTEAAAAGSSIWALPMPIQLATTFAALALGFGVVVGTAISPNLADTLAGPAVVAQAPPAAQPPPSAPAGGGGAGQAASSSPSAAGGVLGSSASGFAGGGRVGKTKKTYYTGTVVHANRAAGSYALASKGALIAVHDKTLPVPGTKLRVPLTQLANGTYEEDGKPKRKGTATTASFSGTVTFNEPPDTTTYENPGYEDPNPKEDLYTVSAHGVSVLVRAPDQTAGEPGDLSWAPPVGSTPRVSVEILDRQAVTPPADYKPDPAPGFCAADAPAALPSPPIVPTKVLRQTDVSFSQKPVPTSEFAAVIQKICPATRTDPGALLLSADDARESELDVPVTVPATAGIDFGLLAPGQSIIANGVFGELSLPGANAPKPNGLKSIIGITNDTRKKGANDPAGRQGEQVSQ